MVHNPRAHLAIYFACERPNVNLGYIKPKIKCLYMNRD